MKWLQLFTVCILIYPTISANCRISINKDIGNPQPLLLKPEKSNDTFYYPINSYGDIDLKENTTINLNCPNGILLLNNISLQKSSANISCASGTNFKLVGGNATTYYIKNFACNKEPEHLARYTNRTCLGNGKEIEIGFKLGDGRFLQQIVTCFDATTQNTLYSQYNLSNSIKGYQSNVPRPNDFIQGNFYSIGNHKLVSLYTRNVQRIYINALLGLEQNSDKYIKKTGNYYLARGHLTAKADFVYGTQQRSTFYYVNVAPQWHTFNENNWNELEKSVRSFAGKNNYNLTVYTGTHGIATLPHEKTQRGVELFLYNDGKGRFGIPVPKFYWKVLHDSKTKSGIAFVGLNNPYQNVTQQDVICKDICDMITWPITWNRTSLEFGYSYCCEVNDFRSVVKNFPQFTVNNILL